MTYTCRRSTSGCIPGLSSTARHRSDHRGSSRRRPGQAEPFSAVTRSVVTPLRSNAAMSEQLTYVEPQVELIARSNPLVCQQRLNVVEPSVVGQSELPEIREASQRADIGDRIVFKAEDPGVLEPTQRADVP